VTENVTHRGSVASRKTFIGSGLRKFTITARPLQFHGRGVGDHVTTRKASAEQGFTLIDLIFVIGIIGVLCTAALPRLLLARQSAGAASAIGAMRAISSAQLTFAITCGGGFYAPNLTTLGTAPPASKEAYISPNLGSADTVTRAGYIIQLTATPFAAAPASCNGLALGDGGQAFKAAADPAEPNNTRFFATNANGQIFEDLTSLYAAMPEAGDPVAGHLLR
jgi:type II secretory pathway pseudopilin PulG